MKLGGDAIHLVQRSAAAATLRRAGFDARPDNDMLAWGPCDLDPARHQRKRRRFWAREHGRAGWDWETLQEAQLVWPRRGPVALWTSITLVDRLFFWRAVERLHALELWQVDAAHPRFLVKGVASLSEGQLAYPLSRARRMSGADIRLARRAWAAFAGGRLDKVVAMLEADPLARQTILDSLPRILSGRLRLSARDQRLLRPFRDWTEALEGLKPNLSRKFVLGELQVLIRLQSWTEPPDPTLLSTHPVAGNPWKVELQLTALGRRMLRRLERRTEVRPIFLGGSKLYGPRSWVLLENGKLGRQPAGE